MELWGRRADKTSAHAKALRDELLELYVEIEVNRLTTMPADMARPHGTTGPEGSVAKLSTAQLNKKITSLAVDLMGADGMLHGSYDIRDIHFDGTGDKDAPVRAFLRARANTIERHVGDPAKHPGRAGARLARRHPGGQEHALDREPSVVTRRTCTPTRCDLRSGAPFKNSGLERELGPLGLAGYTEFESIVLPG